MGATAWAGACRAATQLVARRTQTRRLSGDSHSERPEQSRGQSAAEGRQRRHVGSGGCDWHTARKPLSVAPGVGEWSGSGHARVQRRGQRTSRRSSDRQSDLHRTADRSTQSDGGGRWGSVGGFVADGGAAGGRRMRRSTAAQHIVLILSRPTRRLSDSAAIGAVAGASVGQAGRTARRRH